MDRGRNSKSFQLRPQWFVVRMVQVAILNEYGPNESPAEAINLVDPMQLLQGEVDVLEGKDRCREQAVRRCTAKVSDPVVVGASERVRDVRILDQRKALGEPRRIEKLLIHSYGVHVAQTSLR